jgi:hypothetical protein
MGANAQLAVPAFTAGQVLTAAQMTQVNTGIPVFATTVTRDAAFSGSGEKVLAQGQYAYIEATSSLQVYSGSAWISAVASGLNLITAQTIGSAVASVTVTGAFSSTYENYKIIISGGTGSVLNEVLALKLGATTTGYYAGYTGVTYSTGAASLTSDNNGANWSRFGVVITNGLMGNFELLGPNLAKNTYIMGTQIADTLSRSGSGYLNNTTQYTDFTLTPGTGTITGGTIFVYGYTKS